MSRLSRSLKVTGTDTDRSATYDFLLVFRSNYGPISYRFRVKMAMDVENLNFSPPSAFDDLAKGVPLGIL